MFLTTTKWWGAQWTHEYNSFFRIKMCFQFSITCKTLLLLVSLHCLRVGCARSFVSDRLTSSVHPLHTVQHLPIVYGLPDLCQRLGIVWTNCEWSYCVLPYGTQRSQINELVSITASTGVTWHAQLKRQFVLNPTSLWNPKFFGTPVKKQGFKLFQKTFYKPEFLNLWEAATLRMKVSHTSKYKSWVSINQWLP